ncbi:MAG: hypothetical protein II006_01025 [Peptostreptococcaceae bacterium]|jgi:hypothetical protein|nr:hypothetical protein [Peptostreptococcaceae bacterium]
MCVIDFYKFKYTKPDYYIEFLIQREAAENIEIALDERLSEHLSNRDSQCAYMRLKELFQNSREATKSPYVEIKMNKCYMMYISNLQLYFRNRKEYSVLDTLYKYLQIYMTTEYDFIKRFNVLDEDIKIRVLSKV